MAIEARKLGPIDFEEGAARLEAPPVSDGTPTARDAVARLAPSITKARANGSTWESITKTLSEIGVDLKVGTVRHYYADAIGITPREPKATKDKGWTPRSRPGAKKIRTAAPKVVEVEAVVVPELLPSLSLKSSSR
jgi:hypothetical protein